jgi:hypothetical protein
MPDQPQGADESGQDDAPDYEAPVVEDLETIDGPAVTAAGTTR